MSGVACKLVCPAFLQALVLLKLEQGVQLGLIVGGVSSGLLLILNLKRSFDTGTII